MIPTDNRIASMPAFAINAPQNAATNSARDRFSASPASLPNNGALSQAINRSVDGVRNPNDNISTAALTRSPNGVPWLMNTGVDPLLNPMPEIYRETTPYPGGVDPLANPIPEVYRETTPYPGGVDPLANPIPEVYPQTSPWPMPSIGPVDPQQPTPYSGGEWGSLENTPIAVNSVEDTFGPGGIPTETENTPFVIDSEAGIRGPNEPLTPKGTPSNGEGVVVRVDDQGRTIGPYVPPIDDNNGLASVNPAPEFFGPD